jgi:hypothetical protein
MSTVMKPFCHLKDVSFSAYDIVAYARSIVPATLQTPLYYGLSIRLQNVFEPITVTYNTEAERDAEYEVITKAVLEL